MKKFFSLALMAVVAVLAMAQSFPERVYLCGPAGPGWATKTWPMYTNLDVNGVPDGTYEWVGDLSAGNLKLLHGNDWEPGYASATKDEAFTVGVHKIVDRPTGADPDNQWLVTAGRYKMVLNLTDSTLTVSDGTGLATKNGDDQVFLYMVGDGCSTGWDLGVAKVFAHTGENIYEGDFELTTSGEIKFLCQRDWGTHYGPAVNGEALNGVGSYSLVQHTEGDYKYKVSLGVTHTFHFALNLTAGTMVVSEPTSSAIKNTTETKACKMIKDGQIVILKNGVYYSVMGANL